MRKILLFLLISFLFFQKTISQTVTIGTGTAATQSTGTTATSLQSPWNTYYGYSYVQTIYLQSEINATGSITSISYYFTGTSMSSNDLLTIRMGHVTRSSFASTTDWEPVTNLTTVFDGTITPTVPGWVTINLTTPFTYNNTQNLLIAIDENRAGDNGTASFRTTTPTTTNRVIFYRSDATNPDPAAPPTANGRSNVIGNIQIAGLTLAGCQPATNITASNVTTTSATVSWTAPAGGSPVSQYNWELRTSGTPGSGATGLANSGNSATTSLNLTGLTSGTNYSFYLRTDCGSGSTSSWSSATTINTPCDAANVPYLENFDAVTASAIPTCLTVINVNNDANTWATSATTFTGSSAPNVMRYSYNLSNAADDWFFTRGINLNAGTAYAINFKYSGTSYTEKLEVKVGTSATVAGMTSPQLFNNTNITTVGLGNGTFTPSTTGVYYFGFHVYSAANQNSLYIDDISVDVAVAPPSCTTLLTPTNGAIGVSSPQATITWSTAPTATSYDVYFGTTNPPTTQIGNTSSLTANITGLSFSTQYYWYVVPRNNGGAATGCNSTVFSFTTQAPPPPPANDDCSNATTITPATSLTCSAVTSGTTYSATASTGIPGSCSGTADDDVWFKFVATATSHVITISNVVGTSTDMYHQVISGACGTQTSLLCSDPNSSTATGLTIGQTYYVRVYTYSSAVNATFDICVTTPPPPPSNDNCANAISLTQQVYSASPNYTSVTTAGATLSSNTSSCFSTSNDDDVWYSFTATATSVVLKVANWTNITGTSTFYWGVYSGTCASTTEVNCALGSTTNGETSVTGLTVGSTYFVRVMTSGTANNASFNLALLEPAVVPVTITSFKGERKGTENVLSWTTATETNNAGFELQRSADGVNFSPLVFVDSKAPNGNSTQALSYNFTDVKPLSGSGYYRLKQVDKDGKTSFSEVVLIKGLKPTKLELVSVYPNPVVNTLKVSIAAAKADKVTFIVSDITGKAIVTQVVNVISGDNTLQLDVNNLAKGTYTIKAICADGCETAIRKFVKQ